jgi:hypothetical protein
MMELILSSISQGRANAAELRHTKLELDKWCTATKKPNKFLEDVCTPTNHKMLTETQVLSTAWKRSSMQHCVSTNVQQRNTAQTSCLKVASHQKDEK